MIDKEKEAIEELKKCENCHYHNAEDCLCEVDYQFKETVLNLIQTQQEEIEKKNKIIEEMAEHIYNEWYIPNINTVDDVKEYFINKVEKESKDDN